MQKWKTLACSNVYGLMGVLVYYQTRVGQGSRTILKMGRKTMVVSHGSSDRDDAVWQAYRQLRSGLYFKMRVDGLADEFQGKGSP